MQGGTGNSRVWLEAMANKRLNNGGYRSKRGRVV